MPVLNTTLVTLTPPTLPVNYCPASYQTLANDIIGGASAQFNSTIGNSFFNTGPGPISADNQVYPWLDSNGFWWVWSTNYGSWIRKNPVAVGSGERRIFVGSTSDLNTYDGGDTNPAGDASGPMWQIDTAFSARFPVGAGTFAASGTVAVNGTTTDSGVAGEDKHTTVLTEIPSHNHAFSANLEKAQRGSADYYAYTTLDPAESNTTKNTDGTGGDPSGNTVPHNNLPPFYGVYFIKRTSRVYYTP